MPLHFPLTIRHENEVYDASGKRIVRWSGSDLDFTFDDDMDHLAEIVRRVNEHDSLIRAIDELNRQLGDLRDLMNMDRAA